MDIPEMNGVVFLKRVREKYPKTTCVIFSENQINQEIKKAIREGYIHSWFSKLWDDDVLEIVLKSILTQINP